MMQPHFPPQARPGHPQPIPNYVSYHRPTQDGNHVEHILVRQGVVVGHWIGSERLNLPQKVETFIGVPFTSLTEAGFSLSSPEVTTILLLSYRPAARRETH